MAVPEMGIMDAMDLFRDLGMDGIEVVSRTLEECGSKHGESCGEARIFSFDWREAEVKHVLEHAEAIKLPIVTLTQYQKNINIPDPTERMLVLEKIRQHIHFAHKIGASNVRLYAGSDSFGPESRSLLVQSLRDLGGMASEMGVILLVENHPGTLAITGRQTAEIVSEVECPSVRILYDPANILCHSNEDWEESLELQQKMIAYVHVKDFRMEDGRRKACPPGEGDVPWTKIMRKLVGMGYDGDLSYEYEKKWFPDQLPDSRIGLGRGLAFIKASISATTK